MKRPTDFSQCVSEYFTTHLIGRRNLSTNTVKSYRDTFCLLLQFLMEQCNCRPEKVTLSSLTEQKITQFLDWLETTRKSSIATRNQRLAAIHAFFHYVQTQYPDMLFGCQKIFAIPMKRHEKRTIGYLTESLLEQLLNTPDTDTAKGLRESAMLSLLYDSGARVQELVDLKILDIRFEEPFSVRLLGKGRKLRQVPVMRQTIALLEQYLKAFQLNPNAHPDHVLFFNRHKDKLTRAGVTYILKKNATSSAFSEIQLSPHVLRHTKAMHLLRADVNLFYIKDFLGHVDVSTTEVYAKADAEMKLRALQNADLVTAPQVTTSWQKSTDLLSWLNSLAK